MHIRTVKPMILKNNMVDGSGYRSGNLTCDCRRVCFCVFGDRILHQCVNEKLVSPVAAIKN